MAATALRGVPESKAGSAYGRHSLAKVEGALSGPRAQHNQMTACRADKPQLLLEGSDRGHVLAGGAMDSNLLAERRLREYGWYWLLHADRLGVRSALSQKHPELPQLACLGSLAVVTARWKLVGLGPLMLELLQGNLGGLKLRVGVHLSYFRDDDLP